MDHGSYPLLLSEGNLGTAHCIQDLSSRPPLVSVVSTTRGRESIRGASYFFDGPLKGLVPSTAFL